MAKLSSFTFLTLNGFYKGENEDISWHRHGEEEADFSAESAQSESVLLFGRKTYEMMESFWPTDEAHKAFPEVAKGMNRSEKVVFSKTLKKADWNNSRIADADLLDEVKKLKKDSEKDLTILGSGSVVAQLAEAGLIDIFQIMIDPVALGKGTSLFAGIKNKLELELINSRRFKSGVMLMDYKPLKS